MFATTSVNNVNVNKNVNVKSITAAVAAAAAGTTTITRSRPRRRSTATVAVTSAVVGSMVRTVPTGCVPVNYGGMIYQQCGSTWYQPQGSQYIVINPPY